MNDASFQYPWALLLLALIPAAFVLKNRFSAKRRFSSIASIPKSVQPGVMKKWTLDALSSMFMMLSIFAVANLQYSTTWQRTFLESKWIMIVEDLSGSMNRPSSDPGLTLGDVALKGAQSFIEMRDKDDLIGVIAFSSYAKLISPPTFDKEILKEKLSLISRVSDSIVFRELTVGGATNASYAAWLAVCVFFMLLPEEHQLSFEELKDLRYSLLGSTLRKIEAPRRLRDVNFGHGMAVVLFTDGRIEPNKSDADVRKGLPNFVNVVKFIRELGVKLYLIVVGGDVNEEVLAVFKDDGRREPVGRIFYMPRTFDAEKIKEVYRHINQLEKNRLLVKLSKKKKETRWALACAAMSLLIAYCFLRMTPWFRKI